MKLIEQIGRAVGKSFRWAIRARQRSEASLRESGLPQGFAMAITWTIAASIVFTLIYLMWWLVIAGIIAVLIARASGRDPLAPLPDPEWKYGLRGFGLYDYDGNRIDTRDSE